MTKSISGKKIISKIPRNFILTETDGPFINENGLPIRSGQVQTVIKFLANDWMLDEEEIKQIVWSNFQTVVKNLNDVTDS